jgi:hypothetical protein
VKQINSIATDKLTWFTICSGPSPETVGTFDVDDAWRENDGRALVGVFGLLVPDCISAAELRFGVSSTVMRCVVGGRYAIEGLENGVMADERKWELNWKVF